MPETGQTLAYDGSFPGFLCACAEALNAPDPAPAVIRANRPQALFEERHTVSRDDVRAGSLWRRMVGQYGAAPLRVCMEAFVSDLDGADTAAARAMRRVRREGPAALSDLSDPAILLVEKAARRARMEANLFCGLARFSELSDGSWYAAIEPACDILVLVADHFSTRFHSMRFALHDQKRSSALLCEPGRGWNLVEGFSLTAPEGDSDRILSERELDIRRLWRLYFKATAIQARANPRLQSSRMPKHYWKQLTEMNP